MVFGMAFTTCTTQKGGDTESSINCSHRKKIGYHEPALISRKSTSNQQQKCNPNIHRIPSVVEKVVIQTCSTISLINKIKLRKIIRSSLKAHP